MLYVKKNIYFNFFSICGDWVFFSRSNEMEVYRMMFGVDEKRDQPK